MNNKKLKPGLWVVWYKIWGSYEVVNVCSDGETFVLMGYDLPTSVLSNDYEFIKHFEAEDIANSNEY